MNEPRIRSGIDINRDAADKYFVEAADASRDKSLSNSPLGAMGRSMDTADYWKDAINKDNLTNNPDREFNHLVQAANVFSRTGAEILSRVKEHASEEALDAFYNAVNLDAAKHGVKLENNKITFEVEKPKDGNYGDSYTCLNVFNNGEHVASVNRWEIAHSDGDNAVYFSGNYLKNNEMVDSDYMDNIGVIHTVSGRSVGDYFKNLNDEFGFGRNLGQVFLEDAYSQFSKTSEGKAFEAEVNKFYGSDYVAEKAEKTVLEANVGINREAADRYFVEFANKVPTPTKLVGEMGASFEKNGIKDMILFVKRPKRPRPPKSPLRRIKGPAWCNNWFFVL